MQHTMLFVILPSLALSCHAFHLVYFITVLSAFTEAFNHFSFTVHLLNFLLFLVNLLSSYFLSFTFCLRFSPPTSEVLKFAWIQYIAFFAVISFLLTRLSSFLFRHQVMEFMTYYIKLNHMYTMLCYAMLCYAMLCYAMLCYAMLCYAMLCYAMSCHAMPLHAAMCHGSNALY